MAISKETSSNNATSIASAEKFVYEIIKERQGSATRKEISILLGDPFLTRRIFDHLTSQKRIRVLRAFGDGTVEVRYTATENPAAKSE